MEHGPNILFICTDQQSRTAMGAAGTPWMQTPHMDRLAAQGVRFTDAYCSAPVCGPSRACLLTGRMSHDHGVLVNGLSLRQGVDNFGQLLQDAGYDTAWSGRWHLPEPYPTKSNPLPGFEALLPDSFRQLPRKQLGEATDAPVTDAAIDFLKRDHTRPFCLGVALCNPHDICYWIMKADAHVATDDLPPLPTNFARDPAESEFIDIGRRRDHYGQENTATTDWSAHRWQAYLAEYARLTTLVDAQIGRLLTALDQSGLSENTVVICTSDHGEGMAAHELVVKLNLYEPAVSVPLLLRGPGVPVGEIRSQLVSGVDILPTICQIGGTEAPTDIAGRSLWPAITEQVAGREFVVSQLYPDTEDLELSGRMVRSRDYKYLCFNSGKRPEMLFDLRTDSAEQHNLALKADGAVALKQHRNMLRRWQDSSADDFVLSQAGS